MPVPRIQGVIPLEPKVATWMEEISQMYALDPLVSKYGSPLNIVNPDQFEKNTRELANVGERNGISFRVFFARKANKCLSFVNRAEEMGIGVDTASLQEVQQCIELGMKGIDLVCTAAVKSVALFEYCMKHGVTVVIDNESELARASAVACEANSNIRIAFRLCGFEHASPKPESRFGIPCAKLLDLIDPYLNPSASRGLQLEGLHFHLDGYSPTERIEALRDCLTLADDLLDSGVKIRFIDMGGGFPVSYLADQEQWKQFDSEHRSALVGGRSPVTYRNHGLGLTVVNGECHGERKLYPYHQQTNACEWLQSILEASEGSIATTIAEGLSRRGIELRCEPGRALLNQAGMTVARVEFIKELESGELLVGLAMNRTQCRTGSDDFTIDLFHMTGESTASQESTDADPDEGYLVGAYCTESELISLRKLAIPSGMKEGDLVGIPNTAGYFMHFLESRSHQFPLAANIVVTDDDLSGELDPIDTPV